MGVDWQANTVRRGLVAIIRDPELSSFLLCILQHPFVSFLLVDEKARENAMASLLREHRVTSCYLHNFDNPYNPINYPSILICVIILTTYKY